MQVTRRGFTLIELLVVVLIIGILASIALPQYQKAVDKSRYATMVSAARSIAAAQDVYFMNNGTYTTDWDELAISLPKDLPTNSEGRLMIGSGGFSLQPGYLSAIYFDGEARVASFTLYYRYGQHTAARGQIRCVTYASRKARGQAICEGFGGQLSSSRSCGDTGNGICRVYTLGNF